MYLTTFRACSFVILFAILTQNRCTLALDSSTSAQGNSSKNATNTTGSTTDQPSVPLPTTQQPAIQTNKPTSSPTTNSEMVAAHASKDSQPKKSHTGRIAAAAILGVGFMLVVCGAVFYKAYRSNSEQNSSSSGYLHPTSHRLSNCLELQSATASERRPIMQTAIETEGIEGMGLEADEPAYDV